MQFGCCGILPLMQELKANSNKLLTLNYQKYRLMKKIILLASSLILCLAQTLACVNGINTDDNPPFTIAAQSSNPSLGTVLVVQDPSADNTVTLAAVPKQNCVFTSWSDGNTENPRTLQLTSDISLIANMEHVQAETVYTTLLLHDSTIVYGTCDTAYHHDTIIDCHDQQLVILSNNDTLGACAGSGYFPEGSTIQILAIPHNGCFFEKWSDNNTDNPRTIVLNGPMELTAIFQKDVFIPETESPSGDNDISDNF